ncbi:hypothetical protein [uncultured Clostridium sp.]|uniref:hypothetical protein n=1 Tax=uncultured Clostridium sp. TaxID=59620 RepID=UPI0026069968|nr:hypothetical protein [uncultured Clostridium sp.]
MGYLYDSFLEFAKVFLSPVFIIIMLAFAFSYHGHNVNVIKGQKLFVLGEGESSLDLTLSAIVFSLLCGFFSIILHSFLIGDINLTGEIGIMLVVSLLSKKISKRYICFSYSGSVVCICLLIMSSILDSIGIPNDFNLKVVYIVLLVAMVHFLEGFLILFDGDRGVTYYNIETDKEIYGGFKFYRRWIIPLPALFTYIGYTSSCLGMRKKEKLLDSAIKLTVYGVILNILSINIGGTFYGNLLLIISMFVGHEFIVKKMLKKEMKSKKIFVSDVGICVLDSLKHGKAKNVGINSGDKITTINGVFTNDIEYLKSLIDGGIYDFEFNVLKFDGKIAKYKLELKSIDELSIVLVPAKNPFVKSKDFRQILEEVI